MASATRVGISKCTGIGFHESRSDWCGEERKHSVEQPGALRASEAELTEIMSNATLSAEVARLIGHTSSR